MSNSKPTFTIDREQKLPLDWEYTKQMICDYIFRHGDAKRIAFEVSALLLLTCAGLRPRQLFQLKWKNIKGDLTGNSQGFIQVGDTTRHIGVSRFVELVRGLLITFKDKDAKDEAPIFAFTSRTLERIVKRILGKDYTPLEASYLKRRVPEWSMDEFPLARGIRLLQRPGDFQDDEDSSISPVEIRHSDLMQEYAHPFKKGAPNRKRKEELRLNQSKADIEKGGLRLPEKRIGRPRKLKPITGIIPKEWREVKNKKRYRGV